MRMLGIDFGTKRIGVAMTDESVTFAFPKEIILNNSDALKKLGELIKKEEISEVVIGESLDLKGGENFVNKSLKSFAGKLKELYGVKISFEKEFFTSVEARRTKILKSGKDHTSANSRVKKEKSENVDHKAAALILQRFIDRRAK